MKNLKKHLLIFVIATLSCTTVKAYDFYVDGIFYNILSEEDKTCEVTLLSLTEYSGGASYSNNYSGKIIIPKEVDYSGNKYSVIRIGKYAFSGSVNYVSIPNSVLSIGEHAFEGNINIIELIIPTSVTSIGKNAFHACENLRDINIPNGITIIEENTFGGCKKLTTINIPNSVTSIGKSAFSGCGLTNVSIPNSVKSIGEAAFYGCNSIKSISIPKNVSFIGEKSFSGCSNLYSIEVSIDNLYYSSLEGVLFNKDKSNLICCPGLKSGDYKIPNTVNTLKESVFYGCSYLSSIFIPSEVTTLGRFPFTGCSMLERIDVDCNNRIYSSIDGVLFNKKGTTLISYPIGKRDSFYQIPMDVTYISECAFKDCINISYVDMPSNVTSLGICVFENCKSLKTVKLSNQLKKLDTGEFRNCLNLKSIHIPNNITSIGNSAFYGCVNLSSVVLGNKVNAIDNYAFEGCNNLTTIYNLSNLTLQKGSSDYGKIAYYANTINNGIYEVYEGNNNIKIVNATSEISTNLPNTIVFDYSETPQTEMNFVNLNYHASSIFLTDMQPFYCPEDVAVENLTYTRSFSKNTWQPFFVPFSMNYDEWKDVAKIAFINNVRQYDEDQDGVIERTVLEFITKIKGTVNPNTPYLIQSLNPGSTPMVLECSNTMLKATPDIDPYISCASTTMTYKLSGTYQWLSDLSDRGSYVMSGGNFGPCAAGAQLQPFRIYLDISAPEDYAGKTRAGGMGNLGEIYISVDGQMLDVDEEFVQEFVNHSCFDLQGRNVKEPSYGLYVKDGKIIYIK